MPRTTRWPVGGSGRREEGGDQRGRALRWLTRTLDIVALTRKVVTELGLETTEMGSGAAG